MNTNTKKEKQWQEQEALSRFQLIAPLLREDLDPAKRLQLRSANSHFLRTAGPHFPDSPGHIKRTAWDISRAEGTPPH